MTDALDRRLAATNPATEADVAALDLAGPEAHLLEQIMGTFGSEQPLLPPAGNGTTDEAAGPSGPVTAAATAATAAATTATPTPPVPEASGASSSGDPSPFARPEAPRRRLRPWLVAGSAAAAAVLVVAAVVTRGGGSDGTSDPASESTTTTTPPEPTLLDMAFLDDSQTPTLASTTPGWEITQVDIGGRANGEITVSDGTDELQITFRPAVELPDRLTEVYLELGGVQAANLVQQQASSFGDRSSDLKEPGAERYEFAVLSKMTITMIEVRGSFVNSPAFARAIGGLELIPPEEWLTMLPAGTVLPSQVEAATHELQQDVPLPPGTKSAATPLWARGIMSRYRFVGSMAVSAACGWLIDWYNATTSGDASRADDAVDGLRALADWAPLQEVADGGDTDDALRAKADALASGPSPDAGDVGELTTDVITVGCGLPGG